MSTDRRDALLERLFVAARDLSPVQQERLLTEQCNDDALRDEVGRLLAAHRQAPKADFANQILPKNAVAMALPADDVETTATGDVRSGAVVGPYKLLQKIGEGGMGAVYMAEQTKPVFRRVALKVIKAGMSSGQVLVRFEAERQVLAMMDHPNIAKVLDAGATQTGLPFFVMELVKGEPITNYCDDHKLSTLDRLNLFVTVCQAVAHAHQKGIIHRDIKPSNVLVAEHDNMPVPMVIDFGVAKAMSQKLTEKTLFTHYGQIVGTLEYMSPEQAKLNQLDVDTRSDVYSLGVLLYELLSGATPFDKARLRSGALDEVLRIICEEEPPKPSTRLSTSETLSTTAANRSAEPMQLTRTLRGDLDWIVMKALAKERNDRYATAIDLAADVRRHINDEPIVARRPSAMVRLRKFVRRRKLAVAVTAIAALALLGVAGFGAFAYVANLKRVGAEALQREQQRALRDETITRVAAASQMLIDNRPNLSTLLAREAAKLDKADDGLLQPFTHEALLNASQAELNGHALPSETAIANLAMNADWLITLGENVVQFWSLAGDAPPEATHKFASGDDKINSMVLSADGRHLVTGGDRLLWWNLASSPQQGPQVLSHKGHAVDFMSLSPEGRYLVAKGADDVVRCWDLAAPETPIREFDEYEPESEYLRVAVSHDGRWVIARYEYSVQAWKVAKSDKGSKPIMLRDRTNGWTSPLAISPDGTWFATCGEGRKFRMWDMSKGDPSVSPLKLDASHWLKKAVFSPDGQRIFAGTGLSESVYGWDLTELEHWGADAFPSSKWELPGHIGGVRHLAIDSSGRRLLVGNLAGTATARLWDLHAKGEPKLEQTFTSHDTGVSTRAIAISPDGKWVAVCGADGSTRLWNRAAPPRNSSPILRFPERDTFSDSAISSTGRWIATWRSSGVIHLWDMDAAVASDFHRTLPGIVAPERVRIEIVDDRWLVEASPKGSLRVWDLAARDIASSMVVLAEQSDHKVPNALNDRWYACYGSENEIRIWDLSTLPKIAHRSIPIDSPSTVRHLTISPNGRWLVVRSVNADQSADSVSSEEAASRLWDLTKRQPRERKLTAIPAMPAIFRSDSRWLALHDAGNVRILDLDSNALERIFQIPKPEWVADAAMSKLLLSPDGNWLFISRYEGTAQLFDLRTSEAAPVELPRHYGVQAAAISSDGRWLATGNRAGEVQLWDLSAQEPASTLRVLRGHQAPIWSIAFSDDCRWMITDSSDGTIRRWLLDVDELVEYGTKAVGRELSDDERAQFNLD